jgi:hypothetical protein
VPPAECEAPQWPEAPVSRVRNPLAFGRRCIPADRIDEIGGTQAGRLCVHQGQRRIANSSPRQADHRALRVQCIELSREQTKRVV